MTDQRAQLLGVLEAVGHKLVAAAKTLTDLDSCIGDGDCGTSLKTGWLVVLDRLPSLKNQSMGGILKQVAMAIMSSVGGVSGAIYATAFMRASKQMGAKEHLTLPEVHEVLVAASRA